MFSSPVEEQGRIKKKKKDKGAAHLGQYTNGHICSFSAFNCSQPSCFYLNTIQMKYSSATVSGNVTYVIQ